MSNKVDRIEYIDVVKGLAMFLVVLGHVASAPSFLRSSIYSFHMPLFFIVSGYFFNFNNLIFIRKEIRSLLIPYVIVGGGIFACKFFFEFAVYGKTNWEYLLSYLLVEFKFEDIDLCGGAIWFLVVLYFSRVYLRLLWKFNKYSNYSSHCLYIGAFVSMIMTRTTKIVLPFGISQAMVCSLFLYVGFKCNEYGFFKKMKNEVGSGLFILILLMLFVFSFYFAVATRINSYKYGLFSIMISSILSIMIIYLIMIFQERISKSHISKLLSWSGRYSIVILAVHSVEIELMDVMGAPKIFLILPFYMEFLIRLTYVLIFSWMIYKIPCSKYIFSFK